MNPKHSTLSTEPRTQPPEPSAPSADLAASRPEPRTPNTQPRAQSPEPKISIVTPSFNQGRYLERTILSVLEQGYPNLEYIIIDGGSSDESVEIIKKYADRLTYWISEPDRGQSHAINKGFEQAAGEIFGWLNSDDWYHPGALMAVAEAFIANPDAGAVVGAGEMTDGTYTQVIPPFEISQESLYGWLDRFFMQPSCLFRSTTWEKCGPLNENLHFAMDLDFWLRIADQSGFASIETMLSSSLVHGDAKTKAAAADSIVEAAMVIVSHGGAAIARQKLEVLVDELLAVRPLVPRLTQQLEECTRQLAERDRQLAERCSQLAERNSQLAERNSQLAERDWQLADCQRQLAESERLINALYNSYSWKVTKPLRKICSLFSGQ